MMRKSILIVLVVLMTASLGAPVIARADAVLTNLIRDLRNDPDPDVRKRAAADIEDMGPAAAEAVPALIEALKEDRWANVRQAAAETLGELGDPAKVAIPALYEALADPDGFVRLMARNALFRLDRENGEKAARLADEFAAAPPVGGASTRLFEDVSGMPELLARELPVAAKLVVYENSAIVTAPESTSPTDWAQFTYEKGILIGPKEGRTSCKKTFRFADIDLSLIPKLVKESIKRAGGDAEVGTLTLSHGVFCKKAMWMVSVENGAKASQIEFKTNGRVKKVWPLMD
jgi:hypothetical protein